MTTQDVCPVTEPAIFINPNRISCLRASTVKTLAYGSIRPKVQIAACSAIRAGYNKRAEAGGEDAFKRCFALRSPQQLSFAEATKQAQALLAMAMGL